MSKFGGGGSKCTICAKTVYPAETVQFEKKPYHVDCFRCTTCNKKMEGTGNSAEFEDKIYCRHCFTKNGFAQKQRNVKWVKKESTGTATTSKFGGGGTACAICEKTVYPAENLSYEKKSYHADCFACSACSKKMTASGAAHFEGTLFCVKCFADGGYARKQAKSSGTGSTGASSSIASKFGGGGTKCAICDKTVYPAENLPYEKKSYHADCFACSLCSKKMNASGAAQYEGALFCTKCFQEGGYARKQATVSHTPAE